MSEPSSPGPVGPADVDDEDVQQGADAGAIEVDNDDDDGGGGGGRGVEVAANEEVPAPPPAAAAGGAAVPDADAALKGRDLHPIFRLWEDTHSTTGFDPVPILTRYVVSSGKGSCYCHILRNMCNKHVCV